jgi:hypothetical protein
MKYLLIILLYFSLTISQLLAQSLTVDEYLNTITTAVPFLMIAPDTRAGGMGDAGVGSTPDGNSIHWNSAKMAFAPQNFGLSVSYTPWMRGLSSDMNLAYLSIYKKIGKSQTFGTSIRYFSLGNIIFTNENGDETGQFNPSEFAIDIAYARKLSDHFSGGLAFRYINSNLTGGYTVGTTKSKAGQSIAADISVYYKNEDIELGGKKSILMFGTNLSNIGSKMSYSETSEKDFIPINLRLGSGLKVDFDDYNSLGIFIDFNKLLVPTQPSYDTSGNIIAGLNPDVAVAKGMIQSFYDAPAGFTEELHEITYSAGLEYWYDKQFAVRGGYFYEHPLKGNRQYFTLGAGLKYNIFGLDFAYLIPTTERNPLENTLRFTLTFDFAALKNNSTNTKS